MKSITSDMEKINTETERVVCSRVFSLSPSSATLFAKEIKFHETLVARFLIEVGNDKKILSENLIPFHFPGSVFE